MFMVSNFLQTNQTLDSLRIDNQMLILLCRVKHAYSSG